MEITQSLSNNTSCMKSKIAYFILVHRFPNQFKRLFKAIYDKDNYYLIHLDKKVTEEISKEISCFLKAYPNAHILESTNVIWGGYSMVQAELNGINYLLSLSKSWDFFINLSGQDFPLKSQNEIREFLSNNKERNFIKTADQALDRPDTMNRIENHFTETSSGFSDTVFKRSFMDDVTPFIGGQWMILSRSCCEFICYSNEVKKYEDYYINTLIPDESFFQTVLMNTSFPGIIVNDDKRAIIWVPDGLIKLRPKTFTIEDLLFLSKGENIFARKFDDEHDGAIVDALELRLKKHSLRKPTSLRRKKYLTIRP